MRNQTTARWGVAGLALAGAGATLLATARGIGLAPDSAAYFVSAQILERDPSRFTNLGSDPTVGSLTKWPPGFPAVLAATGWTGLDLLDRARLLLTILAALNLALVALIVRRGSGSWVNAAFAAGVVLVSAGFITELHAQLMSVGLFVFCVLGAIITLDRALVVPAPTAWLWLGGTAGLVLVASLTRVIGIAVAAGLVVATLLPGQRSRIPRTAIAIVTALAAVPAGLIVLSTDDRVGGLAYQSTFPKRLRTGAVTVDSWFVPSSALHGSTFLQLAITALVAAACGLALWRLARWSRRVLPSHEPLGARNRMTATLVMVAIGYGSFLLVTTLLVDGVVPFAPRTMLPFWLAAVMIATIQLTIRRGPVLSVLLVWLLVLAVQTGSDVRRFQGDGSGFTADTWTESPTLVRASSAPRDVTVYSNAPGAIYLLTGHRVGRLPDPNAPTFDAEAGRIATLVRRGTATVAIFDEGARSYFPTAQQFTDVTGLTFDREPDGDIADGTSSPASGR